MKKIPEIKGRLKKGEEIPVVFKISDSFGAPKREVVLKRENKTEGKGDGDVVARSVQQEAEMSPVASEVKSPEIDSIGVQEPDAATNPVPSETPSQNIPPIPEPASVLPVAEVATPLLQEAEVPSVVPETRPLPESGDFVGLKKEKLSELTEPDQFPRELSINRNEYIPVATFLSISDAPPALHIPPESPHARPLVLMTGVANCMFRREVDAGAMVVWRSQDKVEIFCAHFDWKGRNPQVWVYLSEDIEEASELAWNIAGEGDDVVLERILEVLLRDDADSLLKIPFSSFGEMRYLGYLLKLAFSSGALSEALNAENGPVLGLLVTAPSKKRIGLQDLQRSLPGKRGLVVQGGIKDSGNEDYVSSGLVDMLLRTALTAEDWTGEERALLKIALATSSFSTLIKEKLCPDLVRLVRLAHGNKKYESRLVEWLKNPSLKKAWDAVGKTPDDNKESEAVTLHAPGAVTNPVPSEASFQNISSIPEPASVLPFADAIPPLPQEAEAPSPEQERRNLASFAYFDNRRIDTDAELSELLERKRKLWRLSLKEDIKQETRRRVLCIRGLIEEFNDSRERANGHPSFFSKKKRLLDFKVFDRFQVNSLIEILQKGDEEERKLGGQVQYQNSFFVREHESFVQASLDTGTDLSASGMYDPFKIFALTREESEAMIAEAEREVESELRQEAGKPSVTKVGEVPQGNTKPHAEPPAQITIPPKTPRADRQRGDLAAPTPLIRPAPPVPSREDDSISKFEQGSVPERDVEPGAFFDALFGSDVEKDARDYFSQIDAEGKPGRFIDTYTLQSGDRAHFSDPRTGVFLGIAAEVLYVYLDRNRGLNRAVVLSDYPDRALSRLEKTKTGRDPHVRAYEMRSSTIAAAIELAVLRDKDFEKPEGRARIYSIFSEKEDLENKDIFRQRLARRVANIITQCIKNEGRILMPAGGVNAGIQTIDVYTNAVLARLLFHERSAVIAFSGNPCGLGDMTLPRILLDVTNSQKLEDTDFSKSISLKNILDLVSAKGDWLQKIEVIFKDNQYVQGLLLERRARLKEKKEIQESNKKILAGVRDRITAWNANRASGLLVRIGLSRPSVPIDTVVNSREDLLGVIRQIEDSGFTKKDDKLNTLLSFLQEESGKMK